MDEPGSASCAATRRSSSACCSAETPRSASPGSESHIACTTRTRSTTGRDEISVMVWSRFIRHRGGESLSIVTTPLKVFQRSLHVEKHRKRNHQSNIIRRTSEITGIARWTFHRPRSVRDLPCISWLRGALRQVPSHPIQLGFPQIVDDPRRTEQHFQAHHPRRHEFEPQRSQCDTEEDIGTELCALRALCGSIDRATISRARIASEADIAIVPNDLPTATPTAHQFSESESLHHGRFRRRVALPIPRGASSIAFVTHKSSST